jgi:phospholipid/cholesterol/gamma-HCH transport system permease protein
MRPMPIGYVESLGRRTTGTFEAFGDFFVFAAKTFVWIFAGGLRWKNLRLLPPQMYEVGVRSVPVVCVTGAFIGMVMAIETHAQFKAIGQEVRLGSVINLSVVKQIGPVLAAVMLAGRVGGALTAELGTMNVTEQLDALRVMGADPIRYLVVPRFLACVLLTPMLTFTATSSACWAGGSSHWSSSSECQRALLVSSRLTGRGPRGRLMEVCFKSVFFRRRHRADQLLQGLNLRRGASGVGRACTESFVSSFLTDHRPQFLLRPPLAGHVHASTARGLFE